MKKAIIPILIFWVFCSCESNNGKLSGDLVNNPASATVGTNTKEPKIVFEATEHNFGKMLQGEKVSCTYKFKNEGDAPLLISSVDKTCGCTNITFPKTPIKPGEGGTISITYDSDGHKGIQSRRVVVKANTNPAETVLIFRASVETVLSF
ncbi:MAG: DUF1573 domain-containing protein [Bacteroidales bacterium]|nr:DUF1573 domain-containing protein [Bacteroidales bacterium]